jgi:hypothetical protein
MKDQYLESKNKNYSGAYTDDRMGKYEVLLRENAQFHGKTG